MLMAYRTVQYPQISNCSESGKAYDHQIGYRYHVTYLNSAGRQVRDFPLLAAFGAGTEHPSLSQCSPFSPMAIDCQLR